MRGSRRRFSQLKVCRRKTTALLRASMARSSRSTADAAVKIIKATDEAVVHRGDDPNVVIVMQTDGEENVSVEYTRADLAALIKEKKAAGWEFVFLGAGLDAFEAARASGIHLSADRVMSYSRKSSAEAFAATARNVQEFAELGEADVLSYTEARWG